MERSLLRAGAVLLALFASSAYAKTSITGPLHPGAAPGAAFGTLHDAMQPDGAEAWPIIGHALF